MGGFLFGLGLTIIIGQAPSPAGRGEFFDRAADPVRDLDKTNGWTLAVGAGSVAALVLLRRYARRLPGTLIVLVLAILVAAVLDLGDHGVGLVGKLPSALPHPAVPDVGWDQIVDLLPAAFGVMILTTEAVGVARSLASHDGYAIDPSRELVAMGGSNALAGLSSGFVQAGGASQTMAAEEAGGRTPVTSLVAAGLVVLTGAFLGGLFTNLPQATLAAIVVVAVSGFVDFAELARLARNPPQRHPAGAPRAGRRARPRRPPGIADRRRAVTDPRDPPPQPASGRGAGAGPGQRALGQRRAQPGLRAGARRAGGRQRWAAVLRQRGQRQGPRPRARAGGRSHAGSRGARAVRERGPRRRRARRARRAGVRAAARGRRTAARRPSARRRWSCCDAQGSPTGSASSPRSPRPPPNRRACQP